MRLSRKLVFQCVATAILAIAGSLTAFANQSAIVDCKQGGQVVVTSGLTSTTKVLQSFPSCTISVSVHGGGLATIFSDNSGTPLANPFTAQNSPYSGSGFFYAANGRYDVTISGGGIASPITFSDILLNDPASLSGCSQLPALTGDITSAGGTCTTVLPNVASAGTGLKTTINAKGQATAVTTAASTDLSDTALIARLNAAANFGVNPISGGAITGTTASFSSVADNGETVAGEIAPDVTGRQLGDAAHRWDSFLRNVDVSGSFAIGNISVVGSVSAGSLSTTGNATIGGTLGVTGATSLSSVSTSGAATVGTTLGVTGNTTLAALSATQVTNTGDTLLSSGKVVSWNADSGISRTAAATLAIGNGTQGDTSGTLKVTTIGMGASGLITQGSIANLVGISSGGGAGILAVGSGVLGDATGTIKVAKLNNGADLSLPTTAGTLALVPTVTPKTGTGLGNYTTSSTTYVRVDSTNLAFTVTIPTGWKLVISASGSAFTATAVAQLFIALADGSADNTGILIETLAVSPVISAATSWAINNFTMTGDGASHTINLQFKTSNGADAATIQNNTSTVKPIMTLWLTPSN